MDKPEKSEVEAASRKATDVILELEQKINSLIKIIGVYDMNTKLILDRVNKINKEFEKIDYVYNYVKELEASDNAENFEDNIPTQKIETPLEISNKPIINRRLPWGDEDTGTYKPVLEQPKTQSPPIQVDDGGDSNKKIPVIQRVTDDTGKDLFMAIVSITDDANNTQKLKTNAMGKWQAHLKPGNYKVNIVKTNNETKQKYEITQNISVSNIVGTLQLPVVIIKK